MEKKTRLLLVLGVYRKYAGYPNVLARTEILSSLFGAEEVNYPFLPVQFSKTSLKAMPLLKTGCWFLFANLMAARQLWKRRKEYISIYIPYPAFLLLYLLSLLPHRRNSTIIVDGFLSVLDTLEDRGITSRLGLLAKLVKHMERRAYRTANLILVDTRQNQRYFCDSYQLSAAKVIAVPLTIDERAFRHIQYVPGHRICRVLFIGTFVPLQGVEVIAKAICQLKNNNRVEFRLIGDGQSAQAVSDILDRGNARNYTWLREWQSSEQLFSEIRDADICLGIFGSSKKAQRVWPLKNYLYMSVGRAFITGATDCAKDIASTSTQTSFMTVPVNDSASLVKGILSLVEQPTVRRQYAHASRQYYDDRLGNRPFIDFIAMNCL